MYESKGQNRLEGNQHSTFKLVSKYFPFVRP